MNAVAAQLEGFCDDLDAEIISPRMMRWIKIGQDKNFQSAPNSVGKQHRLSIPRVSFQFLLLVQQDLNFFHCLLKAGGFRNAKIRARRASPFPRLIVGRAGHDDHWKFFCRVPLPDPLKQVEP